MVYKIALCGRYRTGKNTVADILAKVLPGHTEQLAFADALKHELAVMAFAYISQDGLVKQFDESFDVEEDFHRFSLEMRNERHINGVGWQWWGEWRRQHSGENYWIDHPILAGRYARACDHEFNVIITDMRHDNEAEWCKSHGFFRVRVHGPTRASIEGRDPNHASEIRIAQLPVDCIVNNTGDMNYLHEQVDLMLQILRGTIG